MGLVKVTFDNPVFVHGPDYEQDQLEAAFGEISADMDHWKDSIDTWVPAEDLDLVRAAIIHFTGSVLWVVDTKTWLEVLGENWVRVKAAGYWNTIGA